MDEWNPWIIIRHTTNGYNFEIDELRAINYKMWNNVARGGAHYAQINWDILIYFQYRSITFEN